MSPEDAFARRCYIAGYVDAMRRVLTAFSEGKSMRQIRTFDVPEPNIAHFRQLEEQALAETAAEQN